MWWASAALAGAPCGLFANGVPAGVLDCVAGGEWRLACDLPSAGPRVRVRATVEPLGLSGEAVVPYLNDSPTGGRSFELSLTGGAFLASRTAAGLAAGMQVGPTQWCPANGVGAAGERADTPIRVEVLSYEQTGTVDSVGADGVTTQAPTYDAGRVIATVIGTLVQRPATPDAREPAPDRPVKARVQLRAKDDRWVTVDVSGVRRDVRVAPGAVRLLAVDFPLTQLEALSPGDPARYVRDDLTTWFGGDPSSLLGMVAWSKADLPAPVGLTWSGDRATGALVEVRLSKGPTSLRATLGWREQGMDAAAIKVVADLAAAAP